VPWQLPRVPPNPVCQLAVAPARLLTRTIKANSIHPRFGDCHHVAVNPSIPCGTMNRVFLSLSRRWGVCAIAGGTGRAPAAICKRHVPTYLHHCCAVVLSDRKQTRFGRMRVRAWCSQTLVSMRRRFTLQNHSRCPSNGLRMHMYPLERMSRCHSSHLTRQLTRTNGFGCTGCVSVFAQLF
jgi:hypothetical protein